MAAQQSHVLIHRSFSEPRCMCMRPRKLEMSRPLGYWPRWIVLVLLLAFSVSCAMDAYDEARQLDTIAAYRRVMTQYPNDARRQSVESRLEELTFAQAKTTSTIEALHHFLATYPNSTHAAEARALIEELEFVRAKTGQMVPVLQRFLATYPNSAHAAEARALLEDAAFVDAVVKTTPEALEDFLSNYPTSSHIQEARTLHETRSFNKAKAINTVEAYEAFRNQYPHGRHVKQASDEMVRLHYQAARATVESLQAFIDRYPQSPWAEEALHELERSRFAQARDTNALDAMQQYIKQYPRSSFRSEALKHMDLLKYKHAIAEQSIPSLQRFIEDNPKNTYLPEAQDRLRRMKEDAAEREQQKRAETAESAQLFYQRGLEQLEMGSYSRAVDYFRTAIRIMPDFAESYAMLALSLVKIHEGGSYKLKFYLDEAMRHAEKALQIEPKLSIASRVVDIVRKRRDYVEFREISEDFLKSGRYYSSNRLDKMVQDLERIIDNIGKEDHNAWFILGVAKTLREVSRKEAGGAWDFGEDGREELEKAVQLKADFAEAHLWLGAVIAREGFEKVWGIEQAMYSLNALYNIWRNGWSDDWYRTRYITSLPYTLRVDLDAANREWQKAVALDYKMREVFKGVVKRIFAAPD